LNTLAITCNNTGEGLLMIRCIPRTGRGILDFVRLAMIDFAISQSGIYLHLAQHETTQAGLTLKFFVSEIQLTPPQTEHLSCLFDAFLCPYEQPFVVDVNQDTSDGSADCECECKGAPTGRISNFA
jgi:hypothetical protein